MKINFVDLKRQYEPIKDDIDESIKNVISNTSFILGDELEKFEKDFADYCGVKYAAGVSTGTDALELALRAYDIGHGDEVIIPANTFIATASAIVFAGAKPVLIDCDKNYNIDTNKIEKSITKKTKAIMPVHLYGQPADMDEIIEIANKYNLKIVEDACQAHGAKYKNKTTGSIGDIAAFSFFPAKNLGGFGDGGIVVSNNEEIINKIKMLRNYGQSKKYQHDFLAFNKRLDSIQAAVLRVKLKYLDKWNDGRRKNAQLYNELLEGSKIITPTEKEGNKHVYHLYVIRTKMRDKLKEFLDARGISTGIHYPIPIHLQKAYKNLKLSKGSFPITEQYCNEILSLPMFAELKDEEIKYIVEEIKKLI